VISETQTVFENGYATHGVAFQRRYPNEHCVGFLAGAFFQFSMVERSRIEVLELGCGSGANLWMIAREGFSAHGIDYSPAAIRVCKQVLSAWGVSAELRVGDTRQLPYADERFDAIVDVLTVNHLGFDDHRIVWREVSRCLKTGGRFFSFHWGENSVSLKCGSPLVDHCTVSNIATGYPYAGSGLNCFLSANEVRRGLAEVGLTEVNVEKLTRTYQNQVQTFEYLIITARK
jgi:cyclopropane fatty-acyl-phospholipid synthase-like methyltransferase